MLKWLKNNWQLVMLFLIFESVAVLLYVFTKDIFYLLNFSYIGTCVTVGVFLYSRKIKYARNVVQFAIGLYMLVYLGFICNENMQIEGFWYYLFMGVFEAAVIHYLVAKILGPVFFGRGWCGYACWTAMVLDLLPYKTPRSKRKKLGFIRYIVFFVSLAFVGTLFLLGVKDLSNIMFWSFVVGNVLYYAVGVALAFIFKDNRAFCKYICPVAVFLKPASYFSLSRVKIDNDKCIGCKKCLKTCPMNVNMMDNSRKRENGTECILCMKCIDECKNDALHL